MALQQITNNSPKTLFRQVAAGALPLAPAAVVSLLPPTTPGLSPGDTLVIVEESPGSGNALVAAQVAILSSSQNAAGTVITQFWTIQPFGTTAPVNQP